MRFFLKFDFYVVNIPFEKARFKIDRMEVWHELEEQNPINTSTEREAISLKIPTKKTKNKKNMEYTSKCLTWRGHKETLVWSDISTCTEIRGNTIPYYIHCYTMLLPIRIHKSSLMSHKTQCRNAVLRMITIHPEMSIDKPSYFHTPFCFYIVLDSFKKGMESKKEKKT